MKDAWETLQRKNAVIAGARKLVLAMSDRPVVDMSGLSAASATDRYLDALHTQVGRHEDALRALEAALRALDGEEE